MNAVVLDCNESGVVIIEEENFVDYFLIRSSIKTLAALHVPNDEHVLVLKTALGSKEAGVGGEGETGD